MLPTVEKLLLIIIISSKNRIDYFNEEVTSNFTIALQLSHESFPLNPLINFNYLLLLLNGLFIMLFCLPLHVDLRHKISPGKGSPSVKGPYLKKLRLTII